MINFLVSPSGRLLRLAAGLVLMAAGLWSGTGWGLAIAVVGLLPFAAGAADLCLFAPLFGKPIRGADIRATRT